MTIKEDIDKKIKNEEQGALILSYVKTYRLKTLTEISNRVEFHIRKCRKFLEEGRFHGTVNHQRREHTKKLAYFMEIKKLSRKL